MRKDQEAYLELQMIKLREHEWSAERLQAAFFQFMIIVENNPNINLSHEEIDAIETMTDINESLNALTLRRSFNRGMNRIMEVVSPLYSGEEE